MSVATPEPVVEVAPAGPSRRVMKRDGWLRGAGAALLRSIVGIALCFHPLTALLVVGWTFRLMRRRIHRAWWKRSPERERLAFDDYAQELGIEIAAGATPRWLLGERGEWGRLRRLPAALAGGLVANLRAGVVATACTYAVTFPGCFLWLAAWYDGWNNSFNKGYEQAAVGPATGLLGNALFILAMIYVPMAWGHMAAAGDGRAFFQFALVMRLVRHRLGAVVIYAWLFSVLTLPTSIMRLMPGFFTSIDPTLATASAERIQRVAQQYIGVCGVYVFLAFVAAHLLAGRLYRTAVLKLLERDPAAAEELPGAIQRGLARLGLLPAEPARRRHPLVRVVLGTGGLGVKAALWVALVVLWFGVVVQIFIAEFINYHPVVGWLNQPLVHLPSLYFSVAAGR
jgi:hypothetical protein